MRCCFHLYISVYGPLPWMVLCVRKIYLFITGIIIYGCMGIYRDRVETREESPSELLVEPTYLNIRGLVSGPNTEIPSPFPNTPIDFLFGHAVPDQTERDAKLCLHISIPRFVVKEQHLIVRDIAGLVYASEMLRLGAGEYLGVVEVIQGADGASCIAGGRVIGEGGYNVEGFEHVASQVWGMCP
jgi:hypothetical protein